MKTHLTGQGKLQKFFMEYEDELTRRLLWGPDYKKVLNINLAEMPKDWTIEEWRNHVSQHTSCYEQ